MTKFKPGDKVRHKGNRLSDCYYRDGSVHKVAEVLARASDLHEVVILDRTKVCQAHPIGGCFYLDAEKLELVEPAEAPKPEPQEGPALSRCPRCEVVMVRLEGLRNTWHWFHVNQNHEPYPVCLQADLKQVDPDPSTIVYLDGEA